MKKILIPSLVLLLILLSGCTLKNNNSKTLPIRINNRPINNNSTTTQPKIIDNPNKPTINMEVDDKPVIYLYPETKMDVTVRLDYAGKIIADYPAYDKNINGWKVTAYPDGHLINSVDNKEYSYLFWEGIPNNNINYDLSNGFVVKGENTVEFLQTTLPKLGLTAKEYNEFIVYWYPRMKDNKYNLIHFAEDEYTDVAKLNIIPKPDSILRVFMVFKPLDYNINIIPQIIPEFTRNGFTVIEWGGTELNK